MLHAGPLVRTERHAPCHSSVRQRSGAKESEAELRESLERAFEVYGEPLENLTAFWCLGQVLMAGDDDWLAVVGKLGKARKSWGWLSRILSREGEDPKVLGHFYKAVEQAVLLFGAETWVLTPRMERALDSFQNRVVQRLIGRQLRRQGDGSSNYPPLEEEMGEKGFKGIRKLVTRRQNTVAQYIAMRPIMDLCERSTRQPGARLSQQW